MAKHHPALLAFLVLCLLIGCKDKPVVERPRLDIADTTVSGVQPDTTALDSLLDSLPVTSVETLITVVPVVDTTVTVEIDTTTRPDATIVVIAPTPARGLPMGLTMLPAESLCAQDRLGYTITMRNVADSLSLLRDLAKARACKGQLIAVMRRNGQKDSLGLSVAAARAELARAWPWKKLRPYVRDSTLFAAYTGDDVTNAEWGPADLPTRIAQWDSIGCLIRDSLPGLPIVLRAQPVQMAGHRHRCTTTAWVAYTGPRRHGRIDSMLAVQVKSAKAQKVGLIIGVNNLNAGCGPPSTRDCFPNVPGTALAGTKAGLYQLSTAEYLHYKSIALAEPASCASIDWMWSPAYSTANIGNEDDQARTFHTIAENRAAAKALSRIARQRARANCIHPGRR